MVEHVVNIDLGVEWDDDEDQRAVVLFWHDANYRRMSSPNDEARNGHRLFGKGLENVQRVGEVRESDLISTLERQNSLHPRHDPASCASLVHYVVLTKEETIGVVARSVTVKRLSGSTETAALEAFLA